MKEAEKRQAIENIELIKELITQTRKEMSYYGGGWISIIWGIFCFVGVGGQRLLNPIGALRGLWWLILTVIGICASYLVVRSEVKTQPKRRRREFMRWFLIFWIPLIILAYVLTLFIVFTPGLNPFYIPIAILLVISTGFIILGFSFSREILFMGIIGFIGTIITAIFFLEYGDIITGTLFGVGLIITGLVINRRWKEQ